jgi:E3 ubiquitin-protein ligase RNF115/126
LNDTDAKLDCSICKDEYKIGDVVKMLPCNHYFHVGCIDPWLERVCFFGFLNDF